MAESGLGFAGPSTRTVDLMPAAVDINNDGHADTIRIDGLVTSGCFGSDATYDLKVDTVSVGDGNGNFKPLNEIFSLQVGLSRFELKKPFPSVPDSEITGFRVNVTPSEGLQDLSLALVVDYKLKGGFETSTASATVYTSKITTPSSTEAIVDAFPTQLEQYKGDLEKTEQLIKTAYSALNEMSDAGEKKFAHATVVAALIRLGNAEQAAKGMAEMEDLIQTAVDSNDYSMLETTGGFHLPNAKLYKKALEVADKAQKMDPKQFGKGIARWVGKFPKNYQKNLLEKAVSSTPVTMDNVWSLRDIAQVAIDSENLDVALKILRDVESHLKTSVSAQDSFSLAFLANQYHEVGMFVARDKAIKAAIDNLGKGERGGGFDDGMILHTKTVAEFCQKFGMTEEAKAALRKGTQIIWEETRCGNSGFCVQELDQLRGELKALEQEIAK